MLIGRIIFGSSNETFFVSISTEKNMLFNIYFLIFLGCLMAKWFLQNNRMTLANGVSASIGGIGSFMGPIMLPILYDHYNSLGIPMLIATILCALSLIFVVCIIIIDYTKNPKLK